MPSYLLELKGRIGESFAAFIMMREVESKSRIGKRRVIAVITVIVTGVVVFQLLSGKSREELEWERYRAELIAQGEILDWKAFIPPEIPDEENFFAAPGIKEWIDDGTSPSGTPKVVAELPQWMRPFGFSLEEIRRMPVARTDLGAPESRDDVSRSDLSNWLEEFDSSYELLRDACSRPKARLLFNYGGLEEIQNATPAICLRRSIVGVALKCRMHLFNGEIEEAFHDLLMVFKLADTLEHGPQVFDLVLESSFASAACDLAGELLGEHRSSADSLARLKLVLEDRNYLGSWVRRIRGERAFIVGVLSLDTEERVSRFYGGPFSVAGLIDSPPWRTDWRDAWSAYQFVWMIRSEAVMASNKRFTAGFLQNAIESVRSGQGPIETARIAELDEGFRIPLNASDEFDRRRFAFLMLPATFGVLKKVAGVQVKVDQLLLACGVERFRLAKYRYPVSLEELNAFLGSPVPGDMISGAPLKYRRDGEDGYTIWSVGWDGDDDGGRPELDSNGKPFYGTGDGDWVWSFRPSVSR